MKISITAPTFDPDGHVLLDVDPAATDTRTAERRVSRTATLDGGCVITDGGFAHADRTFSIVAVLDDEETETRIRRLHQNYSLILVATPEGVFQGAIERIRATKGDRLTLRILVKEKLSE